MKLKSLIAIITFLLIQPNYIKTADLNGCSQCHEWAVIGAGLAGITALAVLIDSGVEPSTIAWIDPEFNVGRVGKYYRDVPGNVQTSRLILYINNCPYFKEFESTSRDAIYTYDLNLYHPLNVIVEPLLDFTAYLSGKVVPIQDHITSLSYDNDHWDLQAIDNTIQAKKVILAIGAHPRKLNYNISEIPLDDAIDKNKLATYINPDDTIAVFGGMHSAILILKYLSEFSVKDIINFYESPYFYDAPGLEGATAQWAREVLEKNPPHNLIRVFNTDENLQSLLPTCTKVIYAIGYEQNPITVNGSSKVTFDENSGIIAQDLYGIGIAFPATGILNGQKIAKNGLISYLAYAKKLIPQWVANEKSYGKPLIEITNPSLQTELVSSHEINITQEIPWI